MDGIKWILSLLLSLAVFASITAILSFQCGWLQTFEVEGIDGLRRNDLILLALTIIFFLAAFPCYDLVSILAYKLNFESTYNELSLNFGSVTLPKEHKLFYSVATLALTFAVAAIWAKSRSCS